MFVQCKALCEQYVFVCVYVHVFVWVGWWSGAHQTSFRRDSDFYGHTWSILKQRPTANPRYTLKPPIKRNTRVRREEISKHHST